MSVAVAAASPAQESSRTSDVVITAFEGFRAELDEHNDRRERLIKASRDCTIASKRLIFLLHRVPPGSPGSSKLMVEAKQKLGEIVANVQSVAVAEGLAEGVPERGEDAEVQMVAESPTTDAGAAREGPTADDASHAKKRPRSGSSSRGTEYSKRAKVRLSGISVGSGVLYRYERNIGPGLEEFIEGASFLHFIEHGTIITRDEVQAFFVEKSSQRILLPISASTYLLGIADLTGELMRRATNNASSPEVIPAVLKALRELYAALEPFVPFVKDMAKKQSVTKQSMRKIEELASTLKVRSAEFGSDPAALAEMVKRALGSGAPRDSDE